MAEIVSYSELDAYRQCPLKHHLAYRQRWTRPTRPDSPLSRGKLWHSVMERHYLTLADVQAATSGFSIPADQEPAALALAAEQVTPLLSDPTTGTQTDEQALVEWMYRGYTARYGADLDWRIEAVERSAEVPLPAETGRSSSRYRLKVKMDLLVTDRLGRLWLVDHKTCANLPNKLELGIDDQFGLYIAAMRSLGWQVLGAIHSAARTKKLKGDEANTDPTPLDRRFLRTAMYRSQTELDNLLLDAARTARASRRPGPPHSSPNPDMCKWRCDYLDAHMEMRRGTPARVALTDFGFHVHKGRH